MEKAALTKRQQEIFDYICDTVKSKGYPPSVREIAQAVGLSSPSTVHTHLRVLEDKGYIKRDLSKPRALEILGDVNTYCDEGVRTKTVVLPLVGKVSAGTPLLADQNIEDYLSLPASLVGDSASFVLRVRGESMIGAGIFNGDYVVVKAQDIANNGDIIVALLDEEATVKTYYSESNMVRLQPENPTMEPIYVRNPKILGKVVAQIRTF